MLQFVADNAEQFKTQFGNVSAASAGAIQRNLLALESQGADKFFGEPALDLNDLLQTDSNGRGVVNILAAEKLMQRSPKVYATFLLWMLSELFETLPEVGDPEKPKLVFFFDEAHLLFADIEDSIREKVEQMVRLIRSKGVGVYFISQNPLDIPDVVLGQLGNRVQHALRAFTPRDQKAVRRGGNDVPAKPQDQDRNCHYGAGGGRSVGLDAGREWITGGGGARQDCSAAEPVGSDHAATAAAGDGRIGPGRPLREGGRSRIGL